MATLNQLTLDADGTIDTANIDHDAGTGGSYFGHCNDAPDGNSSDWVQNDNGESGGKARFRLTDVNSDFDSMLTLNIDVDVWAETAVSDDSITITCRIFDANDEVTPLTNETGNIATDADTTRLQRNVTFGGLTGTKAQWDGAYIQFTWAYNKQGGPDNANLRLYGCDIDGTYTIAIAFIPIVNAFRFYDDDGSESASTALGNQDTDVTVDAAGADDIVHLRLRVDETNGGGGDAGDDWQLQSKLNAGSWLDVTGSSSNVQAAGGGGWDITATSSTQNQRLSTAGEEANCMSVTFRPDGLRVLIGGNATDDPHITTLSSAFDLTTAGSWTTFDTGTDEETSPRAFMIRPDDGTEILIGGFQQILYMYTLASAWTLDGTDGSDDALLDFTADDVASINGVDWNSDGSKLYICGRNSDSPNKPMIFEYAVSTAYDITSITLGTDLISTHDFTTQLDDVNGVRGARWGDSGNELYICGYAGSSVTKVWQFTATTPYLLSSISLTGSWTPPSGFVTGTSSLTDLDFNADGTELFISTDDGADGAYAVGGYLISGSGSQLTDGGATTDRGTEGISNPGGGSFVAGEQESSNGLIEDSQLTADNFTEHVWALILISADLVDTDTLDFRLRLNGGAITNNVVPTITIGSGGSTTAQAVAPTHTIAVTDVSIAAIRIFTSAISHAAAITLVKGVGLPRAVTHTATITPAKKISVFKAVTHTIAGASTKLVKLLAKAVAHVVTVASSSVNLRFFVSNIAHSTSVTSAKFVRLIAKAVSHTAAVTLVKTIKLPKAVVHAIAASATTAAIRNFVSAITHTATITTAKIKLFLLVSGVAHTITASTSSVITRILTSAVVHTAAVTLVKTIKLPRAVAHAIAASATVIAIRNFTSAVAHTISTTVTRAKFFNFVSNVAHTIAASTSSVITRVFTSAITHTAAVALAKKISLIKAIAHSIAASVTAVEVGDATLTVFEQAKWDAASSTYSGDDHTSHRHNWGGAGGIAFLNTLHGNVKYALNVSADLDTLMVGADFLTINSGDIFGAYVNLTSSALSAKVWMRSCTFDGGVEPMNFTGDSYATENKDCLSEASAGTAREWWISFCDFKNVSDGLADIHADGDCKIDNCTFTNAFRVLRAWPDTKFIIANSTIDLDNGADLIWIQGTGATVDSFNNDWIAGGSTYTSIEDIPAGFIDLDSGAQLSQLTELGSDPFATEDFFTQARGEFFSLSTVVSNIAHSIAGATTTVITRVFTSAITHATAVALAKKISLIKAVAHTVGVGTTKLVKLLAKAVAHTIGVTTVAALLTTVGISVTHTVTATLSKTIKMAKAIAHTTAVALVKKVKLIKAVAHAVGVGTTKLVKLLAKAVAHTIGITTVEAVLTLIGSSVTHTVTTTLGKTIKMAKAIGHSIATASAKIVKVSKSIAHAVSVSGTQVATMFSASSITHTIGVVLAPALILVQSVAVGLSHVVSLATLFIEGTGPVISKLHRRLRAWRRMH